MTKIVIFGNSGSGKSTLAKKLTLKHELVHLDLDTIAWKPNHPPERMPLIESNKVIDHFLNTNENWVVEGCYSDLLDRIIRKADEVIFLNLAVTDCIANAKKRPWEPHKYESKEAQDANLTMLIDWISQYVSRTDTFSKMAHEQLYNDFKGTKTMLTSNESFI